MTGKEFRKWRRNQDLTQDYIASLCDLDKSTISRWEHELISLAEKNYLRIISIVTDTEY
jgi:transcriptional regulator with XRE-family HTH domain